MFRLPSDTDKPAQPTGGMGGIQHIDRTGPLGGVSPRPAPREMLSGSKPAQPTGGMGGIQHIDRTGPLGNAPGGKGPLGNAPTSQSPYATQDGVTSRLPPIPPMPLGQLQTTTGPGPGRLAQTFSAKNIGLGILFVGMGWLGFKYARNRSFSDLLGEEELED